MHDPCDPFEVVRATIEVLLLDHAEKVKSPNTGPSWCHIMWGYPGCPSGKGQVQGSEDVFVFVLL